MATNEGVFNIDDTPENQIMNRSGIEPLGSYVLIEVPQAQEKTAGGIIIPQSEAEKRKYGTQRGTVVAVGPAAGLNYDGSSNGHAIAVGNDVAFARYEGTDIKGTDGEDYRLILDMDVKGIFDGS